MEQDLTQFIEELKAVTEDKEGRSFSTAELAARFPGTALSARQLLLISNYLISMGIDITDYEELKQKADREETGEPAAPALAQPSPETEAQPSDGYEALRTHIQHPGLCHLCTDRILFFRNSTFQSFGQEHFRSLGLKTFRCLSQERRNTAGSWRIPPQEAADRFCPDTGFPDYSMCIHAETGTGRSGPRRDRPPATYRR